MKYLPLSLKYRPRNFDDIVEQEYIKKILARQVKGGLAYPAFIFAGPRGVGKTTTARVFAQSLNCLEGPTTKPCGECPHCIDIIKGKSVDVVEIDGASNRGIDRVRQLREQANYVPLQGRYKIYIIDEVHMLTNEAFNALLKTLEEPPDHVIFILATTAPAKVPLTVLSRCQRFDFRRIGISAITKKIKQVAKEERIDIEKDAVNTISRSADGSMRDALVILEQLTGYADGKITTQDVLDVLGTIPTFYMENLLRAVGDKKQKQAVEIITEILDKGNEPYQVYRSMLEHLRLMLLYNMGIEVDEDIVSKELVDMFNPLDILRMLQITLGVEDLLRKSSSSRIILEILIIRFLHIEQSVLIEDLLQYYEQKKGKSDKADIIKSFMSTVEQKDKKLADNIKKAKIYCDQDEIVIYSQNQAVNKNISSKRKIIDTVLRQFGYRLKLETADGSLKKKLITLFDGEEVR